MSTTHEVIEPRSATTGEPVSVVARRNRLGVWLFIINDAAGTVSLLITYVYLWSLNVNSAWAPPKNAFAPAWPFWLITLGAVIGALLLWWGLRELHSGHSSRTAAAAALALLVLAASFVGQIVQMVSFPFRPSDGAYASATFWLCFSAAAHLLLIASFAMAVVGRTRAGLIRGDNPSQARLVAMYATWVAISIFLGAVVTTVMTVSPNTQSPPFGEFQQPSATSSP